MMKKVLCFAFFLSFVGANCGSNTPDPKPPNPTDADSCGAACKKMQELGCSEGDDVPGPNNTVVTCEVFCRKTVNENHVSLNPSCVAGITSCKQIETTCASGKKR